jgi:dTDP-4-dehydrorhamnose reductase
VLSESNGQGKTQVVILRVPVLYGHCEESDTSKSAIHPMIDSVWQSQKVKDGEAKVKVDDYAIRYPTNTADVARVLVDISKLYLKQQDGGEKQLPQVLQFSSEDKCTKYQIAKRFGQEIMGLPTVNLEPHDPTKDADATGAATQRPYDSHLDTSVLKELGVDVSTVDFLAWW